MKMGCLSRGLSVNFMYLGKFASCCTLQVREAALVKTEGLAAKPYD